MNVSFRVIGTPAPQGSKRHVGNGRMVEMSKKVAPWRQAVDAAARAKREEIGETLDGPLRLAVTFRMVRHASHFGTGKNAGILKATAPRYSIGGPPVGMDLDKALRSTLDALTTSGLIKDDARIAVISAEKVFADPDDPWTGADITIGTLDQATADWATMRGTVLR